MTTHFFLGANSGDGVQSLFPQLTQEKLFDLMILKGGPGLGKSAFLRQIGTALETAGTTVEYIGCSGDPDALDGVILPELRCAIADGDAPHALEPRYPAAVERCVDLSRFYDLTAAKREREAIVRCAGEYRAAYARACHSLKAARQVELDAVAEARQSMDWRRSERRTAGIVAREFRRKGGEPGETALRFLGGLTRRGYRWRFDSVETLCPRVYELADSHELGGAMLQKLRGAAAAGGWNTIACVSPEEPARIEHLLVPSLGVAFVTSRPDMEYDGKPYRRIRLDAMAQPDPRARLRFEARLVRLLRREAQQALQEAGEARDRWAGIYRPYVDSDGVRALAAVETARLLSWLP